MKHKLFRTLLVIAAISLIVASWAVTINQISQWTSLAKTLQASEETQKTLLIVREYVELQENAAKTCMKYLLPSYVVIDEKIYCYIVLEGTTKYATPEQLEKLYGN